MAKRKRRSKTLWVFGPMFLAAASTELVEPVRKAFPDSSPRIVLGMSALAIWLRFKTSEPIEPVRRRRAPPPAPSQPPEPTR